MLKKLPKKLRQPQQSFFKLRWVIRLAIFVALSLLSIASCLSLAAQSQETRSPLQPPSPAQINRFLPAPQVHPLPVTLSQWQSNPPASNLPPSNPPQIASSPISTPQNGQPSDYFDQIQPTIAGYLIWSKFPVRIYFEPAAERDRSQAWVNAVTAAIQDWSPYLPLTPVSSADAADIIIWRKTPPLQINRSPSSAEPPSGFRARSAETRFTLFVDRTVATPILSQRMTIWLGMGQTESYLRAAARHELGHALGLWGHSPIVTDVMYFSQVRQSPPISDRDITTLRQIYQQPTRLGWVVPLASNSRSP